MGAQKWGRPPPHDADGGPRNLQCLAACDAQNTPICPDQQEPRRVNTNHLLVARRRVGDLQRIARRRLNDPPDSAWWRRLGYYAGNELLAATPGDHVDRRSETQVTDRRFDRTTTTTTRVRVIRWPAPNAAVALCYGRHRLFDTLDQAPPEIATAVEAGVADAIARGRRIRFTAEDIGRALQITAAEKLAAEAWQVGCDLSAEEWAEIIRQRRADKQRERRRKDGVALREESVAAMARAAGVKPDTMRARLRRARLRAENDSAKHVANLKPRINKEYAKLHKRDNGHPRRLDELAKQLSPSGVEKFFSGEERCRWFNFDASPRDKFDQSAGETMGKWLAQLRATGAKGDDLQSLISFLAEDGR
ncbi:MAG: hypothetical protein U1E20_00265 [Methylocystis sp.]|uniref:hypothetical protein n=1 Tax=Methylocystis sp. TaxID=1911079 RepID=UPI00394EE2BA